MGLPKTLQNVVVFLGNTLEENKVLSLLKVQQWCDYKRSMDAATQMSFVMKQSTNLKLKTQFLDLNECENTHTLTATTTGSKCSQTEVNSQINIQNSVLGPTKVACLQILGLGWSQVQDTHSATEDLVENSPETC